MSRLGGLLEGPSIVIFFSLIVYPIVIVYLNQNIPSCPGVSTSPAISNMTRVIISLCIYLSLCLLTHPLDASKLQGI